MGSSTKKVVPLLSLQETEAKREATGVFEFSAAGDWGSPPLRSSLRRREGGGTSDLPDWRVNSRSRVCGGGALRVAAPSSSITSSQLQPRLGGDTEELLGGLCLGGAVEVAAAASSGTFGPPASSPLRWRLLRRHREACEVRRSLSPICASPAAVVARGGGGGCRRSGFGAGGAGLLRRVRSGRPWRRGEGPSGGCWVWFGVRLDGVKLKLKLAVFLAGEGCRGGEEGGCCFG